MQGSRERVMTAIDRGRPDRIPLDFSANPPTLERLQCELGAPTLRAVLDRLHVDIIDIRGVVDPVYKGTVPFTRDLGDGVEENIWGWRRKWMQTPSGLELTLVDYVLDRCQSVEDLEAHRWPEVDWFDFSDMAERLEPWRDLAVMASGPSVFQHPQHLRRLELVMTDMLAAPEMAACLMDRHTDFYVDYFDSMFSAAPGRVDILRIADDLGMQDRLLISVGQFEEWVAPRLRRLVDMAHSHGVKVMFHSCGSIVPLVEPLIRTGIDILDPLQALAAGMEPSLLKKEFGDRLCLHGGIDTQYLLPRGTPEEVAAETRRRMEVFGEGGGYIVAPCHVLQTDVPTANIVALYDAGWQHGACVS